MFLFIGSFILARAIFLHGLDRRLALGVLSLGWVGARPGRILFAFGAITAAISAWISNTATTAMMFAIGLSLLALLRIDPRFATGLMLMTSFSASIGGLATPVGTPPNVIGLGFIRELLGVEFSFFRWMALGVPVVICLYLYLFGVLRRLGPAGGDRLEGGAALLQLEGAALGPWTAAQRSTLWAFLCTVALWLVPGVAALVFGEASEVYRGLGRHLPEGVVALVGAGLLFLLPGKDGARAMSWQEASQIDWGIVLLYGGGFALGVLCFQSGLAEGLAGALTQVVPVREGLGLILACTAAAMLLSETTSNTASANMIVPVVIAVSQSAGVDPLQPALGATMGASLGFMLPISTPCNAIVYSSGHIPLARMIRYGLLLDVAGVLVIATFVWLLVPLLR
jgi:sodium-dependent dicarboxylate transporter 2/3/5